MKNNKHLALVFILILIGLTLYPIYAANTCRQGKHCASPGECGGYTDSNNNNLCDYGETDGTLSSVATVKPSASNAATPTKTPTATVKSVSGQVWNNCRHAKHCAFPGECGGYIDTNQNRLCDRGEPGPTPTPTLTHSNPTATSVTSKNTSSKAAGQKAATLVCNNCRHAKHCAFPGECGGYIDTNQNKLCDRSEPTPTLNPTPISPKKKAVSNSQKKTSPH
ncbi:MAG TPA: hypothetical protein VEC37_19155 [Bacillota bacterium]|nr:hypothetical protein [Bacillota bacterium]